MIVYLFHSIVAFFLMVHVLVHLFFFYKKSPFFWRFSVSFAFFFFFLIYLVGYTLLKKHFPWSNPGEMLITISFIVLAVQLFVEWQTKEKTIAVIPAFLSFFCGGLGIASLHAFDVARIADKKVFFLSNFRHSGEFFIYFLGCVFLLYALGLSFFYRILFRVIKWQENFFLVRRLPSLKALERYMIFFSLLFLFSVFFLFIFRHFQHGDVFQSGKKAISLDKNLFLSVVAWIVVNGTMILRLSKRIDANSVYYGLIIGVVCIVINFFLII